MKNILVTLLLLAGFSLTAQTNYKFSEIPDSLKKGADYVVWEKKVLFHVLDIETSTEKKLTAVCILNKSASLYNQFGNGYDDDSKITKFKASIYDKNGKLVKKLKSSEILDISAVSGSQMYSDARIKYANFTHIDYPYTIVFEIEKKTEGLLEYPDHYFQYNSKTAIIKNSFTLKVPNENYIRYKEFNTSNKVIIHQDVDGISYTWKEENIPSRDAFSKPPPLRTYSPFVMTSPNKFKMHGYQGNMSEWGDFGKWNLSLIKGRDIISEETKKSLYELIKTAKTDREKIKLLYNYMQEKTRYVGVQLGIGGLQPYPASYVDKKGYGDCKALSNYLYSLLKVIGIRSHYTLIKAGENEADIETDFPHDPFNHIILCIPQKKDTIWLECTNQQKPFNFLGSMTNDRHALIVTENGGKLVKTPKYGKEVSTQNRTINIKLNNEGNAKASVRTEFKGLQYENREGWSAKTVEKQKDYIKEVYGISGMEINSFKFSEFKEEIPYIIEDLDLDIMRMASTSGKRMFIKLNLFNNTSYVPKNEERTIPFRLTYEFADNDTLSIELPDGYEIESKPKDRNYQTKFGAYTTSFKQKDNKILFIRSYSSEKGIFPAEEYKAYYDFRKKIKKADRAKLVLVKKV